MQAVLVVMKLWFWQRHAWSARVQLPVSVELKQVRAQAGRSVNAAAAAKETKEAAKRVERRMMVTEVVRVGS